MTRSNFKNQPFAQHRQDTMRCRFGRPTLRDGFTLIEVVVALAIFVIGALAIIQIFPPALNVVRGSERRTVATHLSRDRVAVYENSQHTPPDAVYSVNGSGNWEDPKNTVTNEALINTGGINQNTIPRGPTDNINDTTLGRFKHIRGEKQTVKLGNIGGTNMNYVVSDFPYTGPVNVYIEDEIQGVTIDANGILNFQQAALKSAPNVIISDSTNGFPTRPKETTANASDDFRTNVTYYATYRWAQALDGTNIRIQGTVNEPLVIPVNGDPGWATSLNGRVIQGGNSVIPGSLSIKIVKQIGGPINASATGLMNGAAPDGTNEGQAGLTRLAGLPVTVGQSVSIDYDVLDWLSLAWDEVASRPANTPNQVNVNLPMLNLDPESPILTLLQRPGSPSFLEWSKWLDGTATFTGSDKINDANPSAGRVTFEFLDPTPADPPPPTPTRTVFRTLDNWAHQFTVAAASYVPFPGATPPTSHPREGWREYIQATAGKAIVYFQAAEAGKLVMVDYEYSTGSGFQTVRGAVFPVSVQDDVAVNEPVLDFAPNSHRASHITLTALDGTSLAASQVTAITAVRGVSVLARTAWLENGRYQQVVTKGYRPLIPVL